MEWDIHIAGQIDGAAGTQWPNWLLPLIEKENAASALRYLGPFTASKAPPLYRKADIFLHLMSLDCCPSAVLEAMASGLPLIYNDSGGTPELVGNAGIGLKSAVDYQTYTLPTIDDISGAVETISKEWSRYSVDARARAEAHFDINQWFKKHNKIFNKVISSASS